MSVLEHGYGRKKLVAIGDSVTHGQYVKPEERWTTLLQEQTEYEVVNKGVSGDTTRAGLERFPADVQNMNPDVVLIQFGFNDCNKWKTDNGLHRVSLAAFKANLLEMICRVQHCGAKAVLVPMFHADRGHDYRRWQDPYMSVIDVIRRDTLMGSYNCFAGTDIDTVDGLHPSPQGHKAYTEKVLTLL